MKNEAKIWTIAISILVALVAGLTIFVVTSFVTRELYPVQQYTNLLANAGFDEASVYVPAGQMGLVLPDDWTAGWIDYGNVYTADRSGIHIIGTIGKYGTRPRPNMSVMLKPEVLAIRTVQPYLDPPRIADGAGALTAFKLYGTFTAWVSQVVTATPGNTYRLGYKAHAWARMSEDPNDAHYSHGSGTGAFYAEDGDSRLNDDTSNFRFRACIDPLGGSNPFGSAVICGKGAYVYNVYHEIPPVDVMARSDTATAFLIVDNLWGMVNSNAFMDTAHLYNVTTAPPTITPIPPTDTPVFITATPTITATIAPPTVTPTPTEQCERFNYIVVINLLPQDATESEMIYAAHIAHPNRQTVLQSADDARRLAMYGAMGSKVIVWDACRWKDDIIAYLGVPTEQRHITCPQ